MAVSDGDGKGRADGLPVPETPYCGELRSKKFFMLDQFATEAEHYLDSTRHCWCYHTQQPVGPDGRHAEPEACVPGRGCYRSALAERKPFRPGRLV